LAHNTIKALHDPVIRPETCSGGWFGGSVHNRGGRSCGKAWLFVRSICPFFQSSAAWAS